MTDEDKMDAEIASMFDEVTEVKTVNGKPMISDEETLRQMDADEMANAIADLTRSFRDFNSIMSRGVDPVDPVKSLGWWRATEYLMLANNRLKDIFCGRDRSPASIRQYAKFRSKMLEGKRYRTDA